MEIAKGSLITLAFDEERYLLAKVVHVEDLALREYYHVMIYDTILDAGPEGYTHQGDWLPRTHTLPEIESLNVAVDHIALSGGSLRASDPLVVGESEVAESDLEGYALWLRTRRERARREGKLAYDEGDANHDGEVDEEEGEGVEEEGYDDGDEWDSSEESAGEDETTVDEEEAEEPVAEIDRTITHEAIAMDDADTDAPEAMTSPGSEAGSARVHTWHVTEFEIPVGQALWELADVFKAEEFRGTVVGGYLLERLSLGAAEVDELVRRLVEEGDFEAGQELMFYGVPAADALNRALLTADDEQVVEDILQILASMGEERAYEYVARYAEQTVDRLPDDPLALLGARTFCYAVSLTQGTPAPIRNRLDLLRRYEIPALRDDLEEAVRALGPGGIPELGERDDSSGGGSYLQSGVSRGI